MTRTLLLLRDVFQMQESMHQIRMSLLVVFGGSLADVFTPGLRRVSMQKSN